MMSATSKSHGPESLKSVERGFTLLELAIVMAVLALIMGGLLGPLSSRLEVQAYAQTKEKMDKVSEALTGFAILYRRLPCPSNRIDGLEDAPAKDSAATIVCGGNTSHSDAASITAPNASFGSVPWQTLGLSEMDVIDAWHNRIRYAVVTRLTPTFTSHSPLNTTNLSAPGLIVDNAADAQATHLSTNAAFVLASHGLNGLGGIGFQADPSLVASYHPLPSSVHELANLPGNRTGNGADTTPALRSTFVARIQTSANAQGGEFDDVILWTSATALAARLAAAGVWTP